MHALALHYFRYNSIRKHQPLKTSSAVATAIVNASLTVLDLVKIIEAEESKPNGRLTGCRPNPSGIQS